MEAETIHPNVGSIESETVVKKYSFNLCSKMIVVLEFLFNVVYLTNSMFLCFSRLVGGFLNLSPDYGFVLEDEEGICGYALGTVDVKPFVKKCKMSWIPSMQEKYNKPDCQKDLSEAEVGDRVDSLFHLTVFIIVL